MEDKAIFREKQGRIPYFCFMLQFPFSIQSRLPHSGTTIFTVMSKLAAEHQAINLSQGFPDFPCAAELPELVYRHVREGKNQYAPMQGLAALRETLAEKTEKAYGIRYNPETEITITAGGTQAIYTAISAFVQPMDEVIVFAPAYDCYEPAVTLNGGITLYSELMPGDYSVNWAELKNLVGPKTRMIIINTPHNPSGTMLSDEDMKKLEELTRGTEIIVLSDEVYEHLVFDGKQHHSACRYPALAERSLIVYSFGKTFHVTGWKTGYVLGPENLMAEFRKAHQFIVFAVNTPVQYALNDYLQKAENYLSLPDFYQEKRDYFLQGIQSSRFKAKASAGTYFQLLDYSAISDERDTDFALRLTREFKLASIPVSVFYRSLRDDKVLRFCFAKKKETLDKAIEIINRLA